MATYETYGLNLGNFTADPMSVVVGTLGASTATQVTAVQTDSTHISTISATLTGEIVLSGTITSQMVTDVATLATYAASLATDSAALGAGSSATTLPDVFVGVNTGTSPAVTQLDVRMITDAVNALILSGSPVLHTQPPVI